MTRPYTKTGSAAPTKAALTKPGLLGIYLTVGLCLLCASFLSQTSIASGVPAQALEAQAAIEQYQQRISRLQKVIDGLDTELELLHAQLDSVGAVATTLSDKYQTALRKFERDRSHLAESERNDAEARLQQARFEFFLVQRQYNKAQSELHNIQTMIDNKTHYLTDRKNLLKRNRRGLAWQQQIIRRLEKQTLVERRLASAS